MFFLFLYDQVHFQDLKHSGTHFSYFNGSNLVGQFSHQFSQDINFLFQIIGILFLFFNLVVISRFSTTSTVSKCKLYARFWVPLLAALDTLEIRNIFALLIRVLPFSNFNDLTKSNRVIMYLCHVSSNKKCQILTSILYDLPPLSS